MASDEKDKKLEEIKKRLEEIQNKSKGGKTGKTKTEEKKPEKSIPAATPEKEPSDQKPSKTDSSKNSGDTKKKSEPQEPIKKPESTATDNGSSWSDNQVKDAPTVKGQARKKEVPKDPRPVKSGRANKIYTIISLIVTVTVIGYLVKVYFFDTNQSADEVVKSELPEQTEQPKPEGTVEIPSESPEAQYAQEKRVAKPQTDISQDKQMQAREQPVRQVEKEPESKPEPRAVKSNSTSAGKVPNGFVISYVTNSQKDMAQRNVEMLRKKGFNADYYYMPDQESGSPELYKVYIGPYQNESAALPTFKKIVAMNDKAFIVRVK